jgi:uncharacterized protein
LVTGASSGIGRQLARALAFRGARLALAARRRELLEALADEVAATGAARPTVHVIDLAQPGAAAKLASDATDALGQVEVLINNAGGGVGGSQWTVGDGDEGREAFELNFWAPLGLVSALVPSMLERGDGAVVNVTSLAQVMAWPGMGHYCATKAALASATEALRLELIDSGVRVLEVIPGPVDTAIQAESRLVPGFEAATRRVPVGDAARLARLVVRALERGRKRVVYPRSLAGGYWYPGLTRSVTHRMARRHGDPAFRTDDRVVRSGSFGDEEARRARGEWERSHAAR